MWVHLPRARARGEGAPVVIASHARKARHRGRCPLCGGPIAVGQGICRVGRGGTWLHVECFTRRYRDHELEGK